MGGATTLPPTPPPETGFAGFFLWNQWASPLHGRHALIVATGNAARITTEKPLHALARYGALRAGRPVAGTGVARAAIRVRVGRRIGGAWANEIAFDGLVARKPARLALARHERRLDSAAGRMTVLADRRSGAGLAIHRLCGWTRRTPARGASRRTARRCGVG